MATQDNYYVRENKIYTEDGFLQALDQLIARHGTEMTGKCPSCSNLQSMIDQIPYRYPNAFTSIRYTKDDALHTIDLQINY